MTNACVVLVDSFIFRTREKCRRHELKSIPGYFTVEMAVGGATKDVRLGMSCSFKVNGESLS